MADRIFFNPPDVLRQMVEDLSEVAAIPTESLNQLGDALEQQAGFPTAESLAKLVSQFLPDEPQGSAAFSALQNLRRETIPQVLETLQSWRSTSDQNKARLPDDQFDALQKNLQTLIRDYPALNRMRKADRLRTALGNEVEGFSFICDARPVYNEARDDIEGIIPLTTLKFLYERQNRVTEEIELVLTPEQLDELILRAKKAQEKLTVLRKKTTEWLPGGCVEGKE